MLKKKRIIIIFILILTIICINYYIGYYNKEKIKKTDILNLLDFNIQFTEKTFEKEKLKMVTKKYLYHSKLFRTERVYPESKFNVKTVIDMNNKQYFIFPEKNTVYVINIYTKNVISMIFEFFYECFHKIKYEKNSFKIYNINNQKYYQYNFKKKYTNSEKENNFLDINILIDLNGNLRKIIYHDSISPLTECVIESITYEKIYPDTFFIIPRGMEIDSKKFSKLNQY